MVSKEQPRWHLLRRAIEERKYLLDIRDVLGYGVGYREKEGQRTREPALVIYVRPGRKAKEPQDFPRHQRIPKRGASLSPHPLSPSPISLPPPAGRGGTHPEPSVPELATPASATFPLSRGWGGWEMGEGDRG